MIVNADGVAAPSVAVILSARLAECGDGLDVRVLGDWIETRLAPAHAFIAAAPAGVSGAIASAASDARSERLVLALARGEYRAARVQQESRRAGLDPIGVVALDLGAHGALLSPHPLAMKRAKLLLAGAIAKARAFSGSGPEHLRPSISVTRSRRELFTMSSGGYLTVPAVVKERCVADRGCRRCEAACPARAIRYRGGSVELEKSRCTSCGLCVEACPPAAITYPGATALELDAQIAALTDATLGDLTPRGVLFMCEPNGIALAASVADGRRYPAEWLPVIVPCVGMLPAGLLLRALVLGADAVGIVPCGTGCPFAQDAIAAERVGFCRELLGLMAAPPERVQLCPLSEQHAWGPVKRSVQAPRPESASPAAAILHLARAYDAPEDLALQHEQSPVAMIDIDPSGCTMCGSCAEACPTRALTLVRDDDRFALTFDATLCGGCELCVPRCPESAHGVLRLTRGIERRRLEAGRDTVRRDAPLRCTRCGASIAATVMMTRVAALLGDDYSRLAPTLTGRCSRCRGAAPELDAVAS